MPLQELTNKTDRDRTDPSNYDQLKHDWYGFNIKKNVYETNVNINVEGQDVSLKVTLDRWYDKGIRYIPIYRYSIFLGEQLIRSFSKTTDNSLGLTSPKGVDGKIDKKKCKRWGTYNEDEIALGIPKLVQGLIEEKGKTYQALKNAISIDSRDSDFKDFLKTWNDIFGYEETYKFCQENGLLLNIQLDEPGYEGTYIVVPHSVGGGVHYRSHVEHPLAPGSVIVGTDNIPYAIQNLVDFKQWLSSSIQKNQVEIKKSYLKYLQSFPFKKEQEETSRLEMSDVAGLIGKQYNPRFFIPKLIEMGYLRLSKRQKRQDVGQGFVPEKDVVKNHWVIVSEKILDDIYKFKRDPKQFYAIIAYYLHRKARNITSWTDMMLNESIRHWSDIAKQYGVPIQGNAIYDYFEQVTVAIYKDLFGGSVPRSVSDQYADFYNNFGGGGGNNSSGSQVNNPGGVGLSSFVNFVVSLGRGMQEAQENPKKVFRELIKLYHSDKISPDPKKEEIARKLIQLYRALPQEVRASNWYKEIKFS